MWDPVMVAAGGAVWAGGACLGHCSLGSPGSEPGSPKPGCGQAAVARGGLRHRAGCTRASTIQGDAGGIPGGLSRSDERWCRSQRHGAGQRVPACTYVPAPGPAQALPPPPEMHL